MINFTKVNYKQLIGSKIANRRVEMGFKAQKNLAEAIGTDPSRVSDWETGKNIPDLEFKKALVKVLKVDMSFFETIDYPEIDPTLKEAEISTVALSKVNEVIKDSVNTAVHDALKAYQPIINKTKSENKIEFSEEEIELINLLRNSSTPIEIGALIKGVQSYSKRLNIFLNSLAVNTQIRKPKRNSIPEKVVQQKKLKA